MSLHFDRPPEAKKAQGERGDGVKTSLEFEICKELRDVLMFIDDTRPEAGMCVLSWLAEQQRAAERRGDEESAANYATIAGQFQQVYNHVEHVHTLYTIQNQKVH